MVERNYYKNGSIKYETVYYKNGSKDKTYYKKNVFHKTGGPAIIMYYPDGKIEYEAYWIKGKRHRTKGPAVIYYNRQGKITRKEYWINGIEYTDVFKWMIDVGCLQK